MKEVKEKKVEDIKKEAEDLKRCSVQKSLFYITEFLNGPMCGRCFPCRIGTYESKIRVENLVEGKGKEEDLSALRRIMNCMFIASLCIKGKTTARFILEWMSSEEFLIHINGSCPEFECLGLIMYKIIPKRCIMCGECKKVCRINAIIGEERKPFSAGYFPFEIRQRRCTKCGECIKVCPTGAVVLESMALRVMQ